MAYSVLGNSINRLLIGKAYWKGAVIPKLLHGSDVVYFTQNELDKFQTIENKTYRTILQVPRFTANEFLRGEIGASSAKSRDIKNKISFLKHALKEGGNSLLKEIMRLEILKCGTIWMKNTKKYIDEVGLTFNDIQFLTMDIIKKKINDLDTKVWMDGIEGKTTLELYRNKNSIEEVGWFRNSFKFTIMMRARSNTLELGWRNWSSDETKICKMCNLEVETLQHFLLDCNALQCYRNKYTCLQLPRKMDTRDILCEILIFKNVYEESPYYYVDMIDNLWRARKGILGNNQ